jgi:citrate synthase
LIENNGSDADGLLTEGALSLTDSRTGADYRLDIEHGAIRAAGLSQVRTGGDDPGIAAYDPAFKNTAACISRITYIDGDKGILRYRGYPIEQLAEGSSYLDIAWLVLNGELPTAAESKAWQAEIAPHLAVPDPLPRMLDGFHQDGHPMAMFIALLSGLGALHPDSKNVTDAACRAFHIRRLIGAAPTLAAMAYRRGQGLAPVAPDESLSFPANFLRMVFGEDAAIDPVLERAMDVLFILHADHEQNCSTSAMRGVGSSHADPYSSAAAASAALYGPLHGGANEAVLKMLTEIGSKDRVGDFLKEVKSGSRRLMGFGHRVYKSYDPRAKIIKRTAYEVFEITGRNPKIDIAMELERIALQEDYFVRRRLYPNVDFYSGIIYEALGFPVGLFPVLFAVPRMSGWLAQWQEMLEDPEQKIARPKQLYLGYDERPVPAG